MNNLWNVVLMVLLCGLIVVTGWRITEERETQAACDGLASIPRVSIR